MVDQGPLARHVALEHRADLRDRHVRLVDDEQEVLGEVVEQRVGRGAGRAAVDVAGVVLDAVAGADRAHHLDVVRRAHAQPLRLEQLVLPLQVRQALLQLGLDPRDGALHAFRARDVVRGREQVDAGLLPDDLARQGVQRLDRLDLVAEHLDPHGELLVHRDDLDRVAAHPERPPREGQVVARVLHLHEPAQHLVAVDHVPDVEPHHPVDVLLRRAEAVDARHGRDHDGVATGQQVGRRRVAQPLDLVVDRRVLLDVGVRLRDVRLGLVVVVVRHEVLDGVVRQQLAELGGELGRQRLVRRHDERGALQLLDQPCRGRALAGTGGAQQDDVLLPRADAFGELGDGGGLVTARPELGDHLEGGHGPLQVGHRAHGTTVRRGTDSHRRRVPGPRTRAGATA